MVVHRPPLYGVSIVPPPVSPLSRWSQATSYYADVRLHIPMTHHNHDAGGGGAGPADVVAPAAPLATGNEAAVMMSGQKFVIIDALSNEELSTFAPSQVVEVRPTILMTHPLLFFGQRSRERGHADGVVPADHP